MTAIHVISLETASVATKQSISGNLIQIHQDAFLLAVTFRQIQLWLRSAHLIVMIVGQGTIAYSVTKGFLFHRPTLAVNPVPSIVELVTVVVLHVMPLRISGNCL